jgi:hypothetical protein
VPSKYPVVERIRQEAIVKYRSDYAWGDLDVVKRSLIGARVMELTGDLTQKPHRIELEETIKTICTDLGEPPSVARKIIRACRASATGYIRVLKKAV